MTNELKISELPLLSPAPSGELPISQMHGTARVTCKATVQELVQSVAPRAHSHTPADIGLGNVNNTSDANKPVSGPTATAIANALQTHVNATNPHEQYATTAQVTQIVTAQAGGLAPVQSVNGRQGAVTITKADIGLGNVDNTSDANKPVSTAVAAALSGKLDVGAKIPAADVTGLGAAIAAAIAANGGTSNGGTSNGGTSNGGTSNGGTSNGGTSNGGTSNGGTSNGGTSNGGTSNGVTSVNGRQGAVTITKADIGLSNVDNTSDANKPVSTAVAAALGGKVDSANARFTGVQRRKLVDIVWNVGGVTTIDPAMSPVFIDRSTGSSGPRKLQIVTPPDNDDFEWFDVLLGQGGSSPIVPGNWMWTNSKPALGAMDVIRFFRAPGIAYPGVKWVAMKMNA